MRPAPLALLVLPLPLLLLAACSDSASPSDGPRSERLTDGGPDHAPKIDGAGCAAATSDRCVLANPEPCRLELGGGVVATIQAQSCSGTPCLRIQAAKNGLDRELTVEPPSGRKLTALHEVRAIGNHSTGALAELAITLALDDGSAGFAVVDPEAGTTLALTRGPAGKGQGDLLLGYAAGPDQRRYPYLTSGAIDHASGVPAPESWGAYLCIYRPGLADAPCGKGFGRWDVRPASPPFQSGYARPAGGLSADTDGDGWEEIQLPLFGGLLVLSGATGKQLAVASYDVASTTPPYADLPAGFHGGRQDGVLSASAGARLLAIGGSPVGQLTGDATASLCNTSRFAALLEGDPKSRKLRWARYYSFVQPVFDPHDPLFGANNPELVPHLLKAPDLVDRCVQIPGDGRARAGDGTELVLVDVFHQGAKATIDGCVAELWRLRCTGFSGQKEWSLYNACLIKAQKTIGRWHTEVLTEAEGAVALNLEGLYTWGMVERILPGRAGVLVGEAVPASSSFELATGAASQRMQLYAIERDVAGSFLKLALGELPVNGRPMLRYAAPQRDAVAATAGPLARLVTSDLDCDGLLELRMADGCWVGYSASKGALVTKAGCP